MLSMKQVNYILCFVNYLNKMGITDLTMEFLDMFINWYNIITVINSYITVAMDPNPLMDNSLQQPSNYNNYIKFLH